MMNQTGQRIGTRKFILAILSLTLIGMQALRSEGIIFYRGTLQAGLSLMVLPTIIVPQHLYIRSAHANLQPSQHSMAEKLKT